MPEHPLDRPVWSALNAGWKAVSWGDARARQLDPAYGPFAASNDRSTDALAALAACSPGLDGLWVVEDEDFPLPPGTTVVKSALCHQMWAPNLTPGGRDIDVLALGDDDAAEMLALALLTKPGPFSTHTHAIGNFIGVRIDGRLAAMAGERMRVDGFAEVSGVCTHPDFRGRGLASSLMSMVADRIAARGDVPFLHTYADNAVAIAMYEGLGFRFRKALMLRVLQTP
ncbi:MAG: GNAT family N-acetyltransferase [Asticcacaulis sp.]|nr:GNAT family N-acetyltransferase [Asticcacaulis sp.]